MAYESTVKKTMPKVTWLFFFSVILIWKSRASIFVFFHPSPSVAWHPRPWLVYMSLSYEIGSLFYVLVKLAKVALFFVFFHRDPAIRRVTVLCFERFWFSWGRSNTQTGDWNPITLRNLHLLRPNGSFDWRKFPINLIKSNESSIFDIKRKTF